MRELLRVYVTGLAMGAADVVPGVSGATVALILGIYDRVVRAITAIDRRLLGQLGRAHRSKHRAQLRETLERTDIGFLLVLCLGILTAVVVLARLAHHAASTYPVPTYAFFFGLIGASAVVLYREIPRWTPLRVALGIVAILAAAVVSGVTVQAPGHGPVAVFTTGAVAITAMVLPGVSGAFFLVVLGQYEHLTGELTALTDALVAPLAGGDGGSVTGPATTVLIFLAGAVLGLFSVAHVVRRALDAYRAATMVVLVSLMVGALRVPGELVLVELSHPASPEAGVGVLVALVGAGAILAFDRHTGGLRYLEE